MNTIRTYAAVAALMLASASAVSASADVLYTQAFDGSGTAYSSQNDTSGGNGNFATVYDNFTLGSSANVTGLEFTGEYFNPPSQGAITGFTLKIWDDNAGQPGSAVYTLSVGGTGGEAFLGNFAGFPTYTYSLATNFAATGGTQYWLSVVPDLGYPPQWGNSSGTGGDGASYQDFFGSRSQLSADMAFTLTGTSGTPEPAAWALMLMGFGGMGMALRSRRRLATATA